MTTEMERFDPRPNRGPLAAANGFARRVGACADTMEIWLKVEDDHVRRATYETDGCQSSQAAGSAAARLAEGKGLAEAGLITPDEVVALVGGLSEESIHCAHLAVDALKGALLDFEEHRHDAPPAPKPASCGDCDDASCAAKKERAGEKPEQVEMRRQILRRMCRIKRKILVLSGKGGVGKSTVAVNLASALAKNGDRVGLLDVDIHGPSVPRMLGVEFAPAHATEEAILPVRAGRLRVMSVAFFLKQFGDAVVWRGPMKMGIIQQFLKDVEWGDLDWLVIDSPPGTGDEPLSVCQLIEKIDGAVIVTTPQRVAVDDVRRTIDFCRLLDVPVLGVVENMSGFACPHCGATTEIFKRGGGWELAEESGVPCLGNVPIDPAVVAAGDLGSPPVLEENPGAAGVVLLEVAEAIRARCAS